MILALFLLEAIPAIRCNLSLNPTGLNPWQFKKGFPLLSGLGFGFYRHNVIFKKGHGL
jgi:hypothetical protein